MLLEQLLGYFVKKAIKVFKTKKAFVLETPNQENKGGRPTKFFNQQFLRKAKSNTKQMLGGKALNFNNLTPKQEQELVKRGRGRPRIHPQQNKPMRINQYDLLTTEQKLQFKEFIVNKLLDRANQGKENKWDKGFSWWEKQQLKQVIDRVKKISVKYFSTGKLTAEQERYVKTFSAFFSDELLASTNKNVRVEKPKDKTPDKITKPNKIFPKKASWIRWFYYIGNTKGESANGRLYIRMQPKEKRPREYPVYIYPNFPYVEYIMLCYVSGSIGKYWHNRWLAMYSGRERMILDDQEQITFKYDKSKTNYKGKIKHY